MSLPSLPYDDDAWPFMRSIQAGLGVILVTGAGLYSFWRRSKKLTDFNSLKWEDVGIVSELNIHPVKSMGRVSVESAKITQIGSQNGNLLDRSFVVLKEGELLTGRECPILPTIKASVSSSTLTLRALDGGQISIDMFTLTGKENIQLRIHDDPAEGIDCGDLIADWLSLVLYPEKTKQVRLLYYICPAPWTRKLYQKSYFHFPNIKDGDVSLYQDYGPFHITSSSSLSELNSRLEAPVQMRNFRPNIVVDGSVPWEEDNWQYVRIGGEVILRTVKPCERCIFITIDPDTGKYRRDHFNELLKYRLVTHPKALATSWARNPIFGISCCPEKTGEIKVGDSIQVSRQKANYWRC